MHPTHTPEQRREPRFQVTLAVTLEDASGLTRDVSASGVFFHIFDRPERSPAPGSPVKFSLLLEHADANGPVKVECEGEVVRVERTGEHLGVAVRITSHQFSAGETIEAAR